MNTSYCRWLAAQDEWSRQLDANAGNIIHRYLAAIPIFCMAALVLIGMAAHAEEAPLLDCLKNGFLLGAGLDLLCLPVLVLSLPGRRCRRQLRRAVNRHLGTESRQEAFARQMLGGGGCEVCHVAWMDKYSDENRVWVTGDYVLKISGTGHVKLVCLREVEHIQPGSRLHTWVLGRRDLRLLCRRRTYNIRFFYRPAYKETVPWHERLGGGPRITFCSRQKRDQVMEAVGRLTGRF